MTFPSDQIVGTLDWVGSWTDERGPVLATGSVDVPDGVAVSLDVRAVRASVSTGVGSWSVDVSTDPVDLDFLRALPADGVESLTLHSHDDVTLGALGHLAPGLRRLYLVWAGFTDTVLDVVAQLSGLTYLQTFGNDFTDSGVQQLASLVNLEHLYLEEETLTAGAFDFVDRLPRLARLGLQDVRITTDELDRLRADCPGSGSDEHGAVRSSWDACAMTPEDESLGAVAAADAIRPDGWRLLLGGAYSSVAVGSLPAAVEVAAAAVRACGPDAAHLRLDLRADRVELVLRTPSGADGELGRLDATLAARVSAAVRELGLATTPGGTARPVQALEICVDALDIPAVLPFWRAVLGYVTVTRPIAGGDETIVADPAGQGPTVWFQQLDAPRPQRNRIHFDLTVPEDAAETRVAATLAAGGRLVSDAHARAFWVLADPEGNEVCICTWQDRD